MSETASSVIEQTKKILQNAIVDLEKVEQTLKAPGQPPKAEAKDSELKSGNIVLAKMEVTPTEITITPTPELKINVNTPPFGQFLITKILTVMGEKDRVAAIAGRIEPDDIMTYRVIQDNDILKELIVRNYRDRKRVADLRNSARWTLEKMYEKMML